MTGADRSGCVRWIRRFVELLVEVEAGRRPRRHLRPLVHPELYRHLGERPVRSPGGTAVGSVRLQSRPAVHEAAVTMSHRGADGRIRVTALAISVRLVDGLWVVTEAHAPGVTDREPLGDVASGELRPRWADFAVVDRIEPEESPTWQFPAGWQRHIRAA